MNMHPPNGSKITTQYTDGYQTIIVPHKRGSVFRYFIGFFLLVWLVGWAVGWATAFSSLQSSREAFLLFWLAGWTLGGVFVFYMLYRLLRKPVPEEIQLNLPNLTFDTGVPPLEINFGPRYSMEYWKLIFHRRKKIEFTAVEMKTMRLRETDSGNRLTIDRGAERVTIAIGASEVEREWLYSMLKEIYF